MSLIGATRELSVSYVLRTLGGSRVAGVAVALAAVVAVWPPPTAQAASVFTNGFSDALVEGEVNSVTVVRIGDSYQITDMTATLFAGDPCTVDATGHVATCPAPAADPSNAAIRLQSRRPGRHDFESGRGRAGHDLGRGRRRHAHGRRSRRLDRRRLGYDHIHGGDGDDMLFDGPNDDHVDGGAGRDNLQAGDGADYLLGGPGEDTAYYGLRLDPVTVILDDQPNDGEEGEFDYVAGDVESVSGGDADDRMIGNDASNLLSGNKGNDVIAGAGGADGLNGGEGNDVLDGGAGPDRISGREGDDQIAARDGERDSIQCGVGTDSVVADYNDSVNVDCELVDRSAAPPPPPPEPDLVKPVIRGLAVSPQSFLAARRGGSIAAVAGTNVSYRLSEVGVTTFRVKRATPGRRVGKKCLAPTRRNRRAGPCTRYVQLRGSFIHRSRQGANSFRFMGRLPGKKLRPGKYRLVARSKDRAGNLSASVEAPFRIRR